MATITVYRVPTGAGDSFNEFPTLAAADDYRQQQHIAEPAHSVVKQVDAPAE